MTAEWNTTRVAWTGACATRAGSSSSRSPRTRYGGSSRAIRTAARSRSRRSSCSGQTIVSSQRTASSSVTSTGERSMPARQTTGAKAHGGMSPVVAHSSNGPSDVGLLRAAVGKLPADDVAVGIEAEPGAGPDLQQSQGPAPARSAPGTTNAGYSVASRPTSLVWVARSRIVRRMGPPDCPSPSSAARRAAYGPGAGTPCHRAAANTRLACRLRSGRVCSHASTSASSATEDAQSRKHGDP